MTQTNYTTEYSTCVYRQFLESSFTSTVYRSKIILSLHWMSPSIISSTGKKYLTNPGRSIPSLLSCMQLFSNWLKIQKLGLTTITLPPIQGRASCTARQCRAAGFDQSYFFWPIQIRGRLLEPLPGIAWQPDGGGRWRSGWHLGVENAGACYFEAVP